MSLPLMISKRTLKSVISGLLLLCACWLFLGIYRDREFGSRHLFLKHRPTFKFIFSAPLGESDNKLKDLDPERRYEEEMYHEYVEAGGGYKRSIPLW